MRRPVTIAAEAGIGLYNDSFGVDSHEEWLSWIRDGYVSSQSKEEIAGMPDFWKVAPSGGEFSTSEGDSYYFKSAYEDVLNYIRESHTTFIGPRSGATVEKKSLSENVLSMVSETGYCFRLGKATWTKKLWNPNSLLTLELNNIGVAPFYENWPMRVQILTEEGNLVLEEDRDISITSLLPGEHKIKLFFNGLTLEPGKYTIQVGIVDPMTGEPGISFANEETAECIYRVMELEVK